MRVLFLVLVFMVGCLQSSLWDGSPSLREGNLRSLAGNYVDYGALVDGIDTNDQDFTLTKDGEYTWSFTTCFGYDEVSGAASLSGDKLFLNRKKGQGDGQKFAPDLLYIRELDGRNVLLSKYEVAAFDLFQSQLLGYVHEDPHKLSLQATSYPEVHTAIKNHFGDQYPPDVFNVTLQDPNKKERYLHAEIKMAAYGGFSSWCEDGSEQSRCSPTRSAFYVFLPPNLFADDWAKLVRAWIDIKTTTKTYTLPANPSGFLRVDWPEGSFSVDLFEGTMSALEEHYDPKVRLAAFFLRLYQAESQ